MTAVKSKVFNKTTYVRKLIKALRSGKYEQTTGNLRDGDMFCLWGLGAEVYRQEYNHCDWNEDGEIYTVPDDWQKQLWNNPELCLDEIMEKEGAEIPQFIQKKLRSNGNIRVGKKLYSTMVLNDIGITFEGLACLLEKYPLVNAVGTTDLEREENIEGRLSLMFKGTPLEKTWREKAIVDGSDIDDKLIEESIRKEEESYEPEAD